MTVVYLVMQSVESEAQLLKPYATTDHHNSCCDVEQLVEHLDIAINDLDERQICRLVDVSLSIPHHTASM